MKKLTDVEAGLAMPLHEAMETQRAVRRLLPDAVDDEIIVRLIELATKAPTGSNSQNWEFIVVKDRKVKEKLGAQYQRAWKLYGGSGKLLYRKNEQMKRVLAAVQWQVDNFVDIPVLIVCCLRGMKAPFVPLPAIAESSYYGSIYPAAQNLLLAARAMGLGAALITLPLWSLTAARSILGLPVSVQPVCVIPIGWPRGRYGPTTRKPPGEVAHLDRYGNRPWR
jgi:nitroreductase